MLTILTYQTRITNIGRIKTIGCEVTPTEIDWGTLTPNQTATKTIQITNNGTTNITLTYTTQEWNPPETEQYITLTWNYTNQTIQPNQTTTIQLTLYIKPEIHDITNFQFTITITATEVE